MNSGEYRTGQKNYNQIDVPLRTFKFLPVFFGDVIAMSTMPTLPGAFLRGTLSVHKIHVHL